MAFGNDHWLASPKREEVFGPLGVTNIRTFVNRSSPCTRTPGTARRSPGSNGASPSARWA